MFREIIKLDGGEQHAAGPLCGWLSEFVACQTIAGLKRVARGTHGHDATYGRGKLAQIKGVGANSRTMITVRTKFHIDRLIVIRIWPDGWAVIFDGPYKQLSPSSENGTHYYFPLGPMMQKAIDRLERGKIS